MVVTTGEEYTLYYFGDYDVLLNLNRMAELRDLMGRTEFSVDPRNGRPVIGGAESLARLMACYPDGLVLTHANHWGRDQFYTMDRAAAQLILQRMEPVELPGGIPLRVFRWQDAGRAAAAGDAACPVLPTRALSTANDGGG